MVFEPEIDFICDVGDAAVTFMENNTYINLDKWDNVGKKPSLEVRFTTVEPRGLLLFAGSKDDDYFALEMFDNKLYMVTDVGNGMVRRQVSNGDQKTSSNRWFPSLCILAGWYGFDNSI